MTPTRLHEIKAAIRNLLDGDDELTGSAMTRRVLRDAYDEIEKLEQEILRFRKNEKDDSAG
jgi:hypothetical protein